MQESGGRIKDWLLLALVLAGALVWPLASPPIGTHGEAREGLVVQSLVRGEGWVLPRRNGELPSKPPLYHWGAAGAAAVFGLSDMTVRLPSALAAAVLVAMTFALGATIGGRVVGWLATGALLGMTGFWRAATEARVDMLFAACVAASIVAFFRWYRDRTAAARIVVYLAAAGAVLTKGPAGAVLPALVALVFCARESARMRDVTPRHDRAGSPGETARGVAADLRGMLADLWSWPLVTAALVLAVGWYALAYRESGDEFLAVQLMRENVDRFVGRGVFGLHGGRSRFTMLGELATDLLPWNLVLAWSAWRWTRGEREDLAGRFLHAWWITILGFFTIAYGKRGVYLLPLYPAIALLAARAIASLVRRYPDRERLFGWVPVPNVLRRAVPSAPALALLASAIAAFDLAVLVAGQAVREYRVRRDSLAPFAREVAPHVPATASLYAAADVVDTDVQVLAYRLARRIPRVDASFQARATPASAEAYVLVPFAGAEAATAGVGDVLTVSRRRRHNLALARVTRAADSKP